MKKLIAILLVIVTLFTFIFPIGVNAKDTVDEASKITGSKINSSKYHFYFDNEKYYDVDSKDTCVEAFLYMKELHKKNRSR